MLQISDRQFDALAAPIEREIVAWHCDRLAARFPEVEALIGRRIAHFAEETRAMARGKGILDEEDVATYLDCAVMYGADFAQQPWAVGILHAESLSGAERVTLLRQAIASSGIAL